VSFIGFCLCFLDALLFFQCTGGLFQVQCCFEFLKNVDFAVADELRSCGWGDGWESGAMAFGALMFVGGSTREEDPEGPVVRLV